VSVSKTWARPFYAAPFPPQPPVVLSVRPCLPHTSFTPRSRRPASSSTVRTRDQFGHERLRLREEVAASVHGYTSTL
jgi:hypothetical protein